MFRSCLDEILENEKTGKESNANTKDIREFFDTGKGAKVVQKKPQGKKPNAVTGFSDELTNECFDDLLSLWEQDDRNNDKQPKLVKKISDTDELLSLWEDVPLHGSANIEGCSGQ